MIPFSLRESVKQEKVDIDSAALHLYDDAFKTGWTPLGIPDTTYIPIPPSHSQLPDPYTNISYIEILSKVPPAYLAKWRS